MALVFFGFSLFLLGSATKAPASEPPPPVADCAAVSREMAAANSKLSAELRQIKREIAALRQEMAEPGVRDVMAGIGYILGLCGIAFFMAGRAKAKNGGVNP